MARLEGKVAAVIGAAGRDNMGQHIARRFAAEGAQVVVAGRHQDELERLAAEIGGHAMACDITERDQVFALAEFAKTRFGRVDIGVNATGWALFRPFLDNSAEEIGRMSDLQLLGPILFYQAMIGAMTEGGSIIQISSVTADIMADNHAVYMGTKAATDHIIRCVANEFGARGIRANSISPGVTDSPMSGWLMREPELRAVFEPSFPLGRIGTAADIAAAAVWLASDECFMTGTNLQVNGGLHLRNHPPMNEVWAAVQAVEARSGKTAG